MCVQVVSLQKNFSRICYETGIDFKDLAKAVQDLVYWGQGCLINPIYANSTFCLTKRAASFFLLQRQDKKYLELSKQYDHQYKEKFPMASNYGPNTLEKALIMFNRPCSIQGAQTTQNHPSLSHVSDAEIDLIVKFLLQNKLLQQMNKHYLCKLPARKTANKYRGSYGRGSMPVYSIEQYVEMRKAKNNRFF